MAALFLVALFLLKNGIFFKNNPNKNPNGTIGLTYGANGETMGDLVNKSTTGDGIPDWEKRLYGLDPTKKENVPGVPDSVTIAKLQAEQEAQNGLPSSSGQDNSNLTQTDKFSQDLFATVAAATQDGQPLDQATVDQLSNSLNDQIQNSAPRKVWTMADIQVTNDNSVNAVKKYDVAFNNLYPKNLPNYTPMDVLQKFVGDGTSVDDSALSELNPIILQINGVIVGMTKIEVPQSIAVFHLNFLNALEDIQENLSDVRLYDTDSLAAFTAINQYSANAAKVATSMESLSNAINQKLKQ